MSANDRMTVFLSAPPRGVRRRHRSRYANLPAMQRLAMDHDPAARRPAVMSGAWLARRWYLTFKTRRAYSVRPVSPGDRRLLADFTHELGASASERDRSSVRELTTILLDRVLVGEDGAMAFVALENTASGDRVIGACAYATESHEGAEFAMAVANSHRQEQVGRTLLLTLLREAKRVGIRRLVGQMHWSNRPMQMLAASMGFQALPSPRDRNARLLVLEIK
jgi:N-acetylglutamate synthase-like GNAT family acetyltransferase